MPRLFCILFGKTIKILMVKSVKDINELKGKSLEKTLNNKICFFENLFSKDSLFRLRKLHIANNTVKFDCAVIFFDGMVDSEKINNGLLRSLLTANKKAIEHSVIDFLEKQVLFNDEVARTSDVFKMLSAVNSGDTLLLLDETTDVLIINTKGWDKRGVSEPENERVTQGPREGFGESVISNSALIRRKLATPDLCFESITVGIKTQTTVFVAYLKSLADKKLIDNIKKEISNIKIDGILDTNYINELINKNRFSLFKTAGSTERPDIAAARLLEGRIAIIADGTPVVLTLPYLFTENFQSDDDYYVNFTYAFLGRILRYICYNTALLLPSLYLAAVLFHPNLLPASFYAFASASRIGIPFSSIGECLILIVIFEILRETGARMQESVGHTLSIVGGLVIGQAAVDAKLVSAPMLIVVALSGISGLMVPRLKAATIYGKLFLVILAALFGIFGVFAGVTLIHIHLYCLESFNVDYMSTVSIFSKESMKDTFYRTSWRKMLTRPKALTGNIIRQRRNDD